MGEIVCTDVTKVWGAETAREVLALDSVSLSVRDGEFRVVIGPGGYRSLIFQQPSLYPWLSALDSVSIDMPRPRNVIGEDFERYRTLFVERLRAEVTKALEQELAEMLETRIK